MSSLPIKRTLKLLSLGLLAILIAGALFLFRPWSEHQGWRFFGELIPFNDRAETFSNWHKVQEQAYLKASNNPRMYERNLMPLSAIRYEFDGQTYTAEDYFRKGNLTGLMVVQDGQIVAEHYAQNVNKDTTYHLWSATKSFTGTLVGIALHDGVIESLDDHVEKYAPQFTGTAYGETPIKHVLMMSSGIDFFHHKGKPNRIGMYFDLFILGKDFDSWVASLPRGRSSGTDFNYIATDTHVLSRVIEGAYGRPFINVVQEKLWGPGGFSSDAQWGIDGSGIPMGHCCLSVTLQDFANLGQIYLDDLVLDGQSVVNDDWIEMVEHAQGPFQEPRKARDGEYLDGYSLQWWLPVDYDQEFIARGASGQYLYVNRKEGYVVAQFSARGNVSTREEESFYRAVGKYLKDLN